MAAKREVNTRPYDLFKGFIALVLVIVIVILAVQPRSRPPKEAALAAGPTASVLVPTDVPVAEPTAPQPKPTDLPAAEPIALPIINPPAVGDGGSVSLTGTGRPGATVELWDGTAKLSSATAGPDGTWSWSGTLEPGDHSLIARTVDASGKVLNESSAVPVSVPELVVEIALPAINAPTVGEAGSVSLTGTGEPGATVELWDGTAKLGSVVVGKDGAWSWSGTLEPGDHSLTARTVDSSGTVLNESSAVPVTVAAAAPVAPALNEPQAGADGTVTLSGTGEPGSTVEILQDGTVVGTATVQADGTWTLAYASTPGTHQVAVRSQAEPDVVSAAVTIVVPEPAAEPGEGQAYVVKPGDTLSGLAQQFYGNPQLWRLIYEATNARAAEDPTIHALASPNYIKPGWKLWIPAQ